MARWWHWAAVCAGVVEWSPLIDTDFRGILFTLNTPSISGMAPSEPCRYCPANSEGVRYLSAECILRWLQSSNATRIASSASWMSANFRGLLLQKTFGFDRSHSSGVHPSAITDTFPVSFSHIHYLATRPRIHDSLANDIRYVVVGSAAQPHLNLMI